SRDSLKTPSKSKGSGTLNEGAAVGDKEHDEDTPLNTPLLYSHNPASDFFSAELGQVDGNLTASNTDGKTIYNSSGNQLPNTVSCSCDNTANDPNYTGNNECELSS